ncbi:PC4 and SFRS1-interacting protein-like [Thrips palmi]|uniref:PC4 and SFRS1-interacting protein-like n=1 Tax=Thrips palmi TaxID=161013 RepID=A0A6P8ZLB7_THRPL|nr:PC4 and SFRS1-interacting protein-like [Thrips palmi]XP_034238573.1 PC4 and SFRS1-interacting protein-like [Thrips palmi]XP_034238574.1 PC4 and SFRS1-interacting protein-like [Thrips palmi]XP_034238575.1 PC4 and SFRS1-interacting protein-like [Thrips palmi]
MSLKFKSGDRVFAKVRGYPFWPARVEACADETPNKMKYHVFFYGTNETAICKVEEIIPYAPNKDKYAKPLKRKGFNEGLHQIEMELNGFAPTYPPFSESTMDEEPDIEGSLIIDENLSSSITSNAVPVEKKKKITTVLKRKRESMDSVSEDFEKRKQARLSAGTPVGGAPSGRSSVDGDSPNSKVKAVSRSGRKIKPKKFADDDEDIETVNDTYDNNSGGITGIPPEVPSASIVSPVTLPSSPEPLKTRKPQAQRTSIPPTQPSPDESAKTPVDTQGGIPSDNPNRAIMAKALSGHWVQIRLDDERPSSFQSEEARRLWDAATARNAERLKAQIELGEYLPDTIKKQLEGKVDLTDAQKKELKKETELNRKRGKLRWLKQEAHLLELDAQIRGSLSLARADASRCLQLMDEMLYVNIDPLMLKKHPNIVETVKKLQRYIGNASKWHLTDEEMDKFVDSCEQIRLKATHMYHKFKKLFAVPHHTSFWEIFHQEVQKFNKAVKHMTKDKVYALVVDPEKLTSVNDTEGDAQTESPDKAKSSKNPRRKKSASNTDSHDLKSEEVDLGKFEAT